MVTFVATLVAIYSAGYMHGERVGYAPASSSLHRVVRVFDDHAGFGQQFPIALRVLGRRGPVQLFPDRILVSKARSGGGGKKAFLVNRIGDVGFALALFLMWMTYGTLNLQDAHGVAGVLGQARLGAGIRRLCHRRRGHGHLPAAVGRGLWQKRSVSAARLASRRDGRPHAGA